MDTIVKELRTCAATLSHIADTLAKPSETKEAAAHTLEEVRKVLAELSKEGLTDKVREIIKKHGAERLSEVNPVEYAVILKEAEELGK